VIVAHAQRRGVHAPGRHRRSGATPISALDANPLGDITNTRKITASTARPAVAAGDAPPPAAPGSQTSIRSMAAAMLVSVLLGPGRHS
jgi:hypothetical protein